MWDGFRGLIILTVLYLIGEWMSGYIPFPVPGAVLGMVIVFALLQLHLLPLAWVNAGAVWLLSFMGLFYVPYGVGIVDSGELIQEWGVPIIIIMGVTVLTVFGVSAWIFQNFIDKSSMADE